MKLTFKTYQNLYNDTIQHLLHKVPRTVGVIAGVPRSGMLPATILATELHLPLGMATDVGVVIVNGGHRSPHTVEGNTVLLVDDSVNAGNSIRRFAEVVANNNIVLGCVYTSPRGKDVVDVWGLEIGSPRIFEWNLFNSWATEKGMFDLDGVFCEDVRVWDDDGSRYQNAIANATPLHRPRTPVGAVCTNRIERWRGLTDDWFARHHILVHDLIMQPYKTAAERRKRSCPGKFKRDRFAESKAKIFVESHDWQARVIGECGKPVISLESKRVF